MSTIYEIGKSYYFLDSTNGALLATYLSQNGYNLSDFGGFVVDSGSYAGYYFDTSAINDDEYDILEQYSPNGEVAFRAIWDSVQAHYFL